jgi:hypothetical protein
MPNSKCFGRTLSYNNVWYLKLATVSCTAHVHPSWIFFTLLYLRRQTQTLISICREHLGSPETAPGQSLGPSSVSYSPIARPASANTPYPTCSFATEPQVSGASVSCRMDLWGSIHSDDCAPYSMVDTLSFIMWIVHGSCPLSAASGLHSDGIERLA